MLMPNFERLNERTAMSPKGCLSDFETCDFVPTGADPCAVGCLAVVASV
jgi:hypothetical protein